MSMTHPPTPTNGIHKVEMPDGVQRIRSVSHELTVARNEMIRAHNRLNEFLERGTVPEDLKRSG